MNNIIAKDWLNRQSKFRQMTYFQQSAKVFSRQNFQPYGILFANSQQAIAALSDVKLLCSIVC